jgi:hypothetical protein
MGLFGHKYPDSIVNRLHKKQRHQTGGRTRNYGRLP